MSIKFWSRFLSRLDGIKGGYRAFFDRLLTQVARVQTVNGLDALTPEIIDAARDALLIGH